MIYKKWRELSVDPYRIKYKSIKLKQIISYLPAGNDVLECIFSYKNSNQHFILKYERSKMADFESEYNTINYLKNTDFNNLIPIVIESGKFNNKNYLVLEKKEGRRLSEILKNKKIDKKKYLFKYGKSLANLHSLTINKMFIAKQRIINDVPSKEVYKDINEKILPYIKYLKENKPDIEYNTFIHGDYHYANILWRYSNISAILDFEYSGLGFKEQDIAWALVLRPTQVFMNNKEDIKTFLEGYLSVGSYDSKKLKWCLINAYCHFYLMNQNNKEYTNKLIKLISIINEFVI